MRSGTHWRGILAKTGLVLVAGMLCMGQTCTIDADDSDGDGVLNAADGCPFDPDKIEPGECGCGIPDVDEDENGIADCLEGGCGCGGDN